MVRPLKQRLLHTHGFSRPLNYLWLRASPAGAQGLVKGKCTVDVHSFSQSISVLNSVADFALLVVPPIALGGLKMSFNRKIGLIAIFSIGTL